MKHIFEDFVLDAAQRELRQDGAAVAMEPKVFDLLLYLIENSERVVAKDELVDAIWDGRFISDAALSTAISSLRRALGDDGHRQAFVKTMHGRGFRFVAATVQSGAQSKTADVHRDEQSIRFCHSIDGTRIAYARAGDGPPLVKTSHWLTHLEFDWDSPVWNHVHGHLVQSHELIRFDPRGNGLSQWEVEDFSLDRQVEDLEAVVEAAGLDRFPILGVSQAAAVSVAYAVKNPERVTKMVFYGGYAKGWHHSASPQRRETNRAAMTLVENIWGGSMAAQQMFSSLFMPDAPPEYLKWFSELQQTTSSAKNAANLIDMIGHVDVRHLLGQIDVPVLVLHARKDQAVPFRDGQELAAGIPGARFVPLETSNHILPETDPAWHRCARLMTEFLTD